MRSPDCCCRTFGHGIQCIDCPIHGNDVPAGEAEAFAVCVCGYRCRSRHPYGTDVDALECPRCGEMTLATVE